jgi:NADH:ubiquinone oxidoreductase subunit K
MFRGMEAMLIPSSAVILVSAYLTEFEQSNPGMMQDPWWREVTLFLGLAMFLGGAIGIFVNRRTLRREVAIGGAISSILAVSAYMSVTGGYTYNLYVMTVCIALVIFGTFAVLYHRDGPVQENP